MKLKSVFHMFMLIALFTFLSTAMAQEKKASDSEYSIDAKTAFERWHAAPDKIKILDVRTTGEYVFVGHAPMAYNIPFLFFAQEWNNEKEKYNMPANEDFVAEVKKKFRTTDTIFVMCRSGSRSAKSIQLLKEAGFKYLYNIEDGFEGTTLKMEDSYNNGQRIVNGWKNSGSPWTYSLDPELVYNPKH
ncbi:MAG: sulfurtransferase [Deferribacteres bacterium]|nr:sulfurtransferase [candidate division KSB1 bacterium]MCB9500420.1 sulfurtransferase [Deferribacteres bacterium]